jgi:2-polyprenyl-3-methyl-5-hydroxy-6-metoxy-1,4-benzoquinol methylase
MSLNPLSDPTLAFYDAHAEAFVQRTLGVDMSSVYSRFLPFIPPGGHILDAGCGSGRDSRAFLDRGFRVTAFDGSAALAKIASETSKVQVSHRTFAEIDWQEEFDGVWACASLLHLAGPPLEDAVRRLVDALKIGGTLYASFKKGTGAGFRDGRFFADHDSTSLAQLIMSMERLKTVDIWESEDQRRQEVVWVNGLCQRST